MGGSKGVAILLNCKGETDRIRHTIDTVEKVILCTLKNNIYFCFFFLIIELFYCISRVRMTVVLPEQSMSSQDTTLIWNGHFWLFGNF